MIKKIILCIWVAVLLTACHQKESEDTTLLWIDGEAIQIQEGQLYLELTKQAFEKTGGREVWDLSLSGRDPEQTAADAALESLIRTKILSRQILKSELSPEEQQNIERGTERLIEKMGPETLETIGLSKGQIRKCMEESYRAWKYRKSLVFLPGNKEKELEYQTAEAFVQYETIDQTAYLQKVEMDVIMVYKGEWIYDKWVEYPLSQQKEKLEYLKEAQHFLEEGKGFTHIRKVYSDDTALADNFLLHAGTVQADREKDTIFYRGQIQKDLAEKIFRTPVGSYTDILETQYGYLIAYVQGYTGVEAADYEVFRLQLAQAKEEYRRSLMKEFSEKQFQEEYERLKSEVQIDINEKLWETVIGSHPES